MRLDGHDVIRTVVIVDALLRRAGHILALQKDGRGVSRRCGEREGNQQRQLLHVSLRRLRTQGGYLFTEVNATSLVQAGLGLQSVVSQLPLP